MEEQVHQEHLQDNAESDSGPIPRLEVISECVASGMRQEQELEQHRAMAKVNFDHQKHMLKLEVVQRRLKLKAELEHERALSELGRQDAGAVNTGVQDGENTASRAVDHLGPSRTAEGRVQTQLYRIESEADGQLYSMEGGLLKRVGVAEGAELF